MNPSQMPVIGWDVGGANIKVAYFDPGRRGPIVLERPFPLWRERDRLSSVLAELADQIGRVSVMAVTMTAELADCFATKRHGIGFVVGAFETAFPAASLWLYGVDGRFRSAGEACRCPLDVAAANWMASASLVARTHPDALFVDVGSTTTDIIPISAGRVAAAGCTDPARLRSGELVYTGCLRTPVCAIVRTVPLGPGWCRVAAEHFAIAADVHRWLGSIADDEYTCETPDSRGRSRRASAVRLARVVCADREMLRDEAVTAIARHVASTQTRQITHGIRQVLRRLGSARPQVAVVAGSGAFLARAAVRAAALDVCDLPVEFGSNAGRAAPAVAVARLFAEQVCTQAP